MKVKRESILFLGLAIVITSLIMGLLVVTTIPDLDVGFIQNQTELTKTGYVEDIEFLDSGFGEFSEHTIVRFDDGDVVVLQYWKMEIPTKQNVTLCYHNNGYERYFLDNFTVSKEMKR